MEDDFFDWLNDCPVQCILNKTDTNGNREYLFYDNTKDEEDKED